MAKKNIKLLLQKQREEKIDEALGEYGVFGVPSIPQSPGISARDVSGRAWNADVANATQRGDDIKLINELEQTELKKTLETGTYQKKSPKIPMK